MDRVEFITNKGRDFGAGGSGGGKNVARMDAKKPRVVAIGGGLGGHMHHFRAYYID